MKILSTFIALIFCSTVFGLNDTDNQKKGTVTIFAHESIRNYEKNHVLELKVYVDGKFWGLLTKAHLDISGCGAEGAITKSLSEGVHTIKVNGIHRDAKDHRRQQTIEWNGTFQVKEGVCSMIKIDKDDNPELIDSSCQEIGELGIWLHESMRSKVRDIKIYIDDQYVGSLNTYHSTDRSCGDRGMLTKKLTCGAHNIKIKGINKHIKSGSGKYYVATANLELEGQCVMLPIHYQQ